MGFLGPSISRVHKEKTSSKWELCGEVRGRVVSEVRRIGRLDRKATVAQMSLHYLQGMHNTISESASNLKGEVVQQKKITPFATPVSYERESYNSDKFFWNVLGLYITPCSRGPFWKAGVVKILIEFRRQRYFDTISTNVKNIVAYSPKLPRTSATTNYQCGAMEGLRRARNRRAEVSGDWIRRCVPLGQQLFSKVFLCLQKPLEGTEGWSCSARAQEAIPPLGNKI